MEKRVLVLVVFSILLLPSVYAAFTAPLDVMEIEFNGDENPAATKTLTFEAPQFIARTYVDFISSGTLTFYYKSAVVKTISKSTTGTGWYTPNVLTDKVILTDFDGVYSFFATVTNKTVVNRNELTDLGSISLYFPTTAFDSDLDNQRIRTFHADVDNPPSKVLLFVGNTPDGLNDEMSFVDGGASGTATHIYGCIDGDMDGFCDFEQTDCTDGGGDVYASRCCGGTSSDTSCGYYPDVNAWCGETASGPEWAIPEDAGEIHTFTDCPSSTKLVGSGTALYYCGTSVSSGATAFPTSSGSTPYALANPVQVVLNVNTRTIPDVSAEFFNVTVLCNDCYALSAGKDIPVSDNTFFIRQWDGSYLSGTSPIATSYPGTYDVIVDASDVVQFFGSTSSPTEFQYVSDSGSVSLYFVLSSANVSWSYLVPEHGKLRFQSAKSASANIVPITLATQTHDYACQDSVITECAGDEQQNPFSDDWDTLGEIKTFSGVPFYCASDGDYTPDLDIKNKASCEAFGFKWTGTKCCSEADDPGETYEDPGIIGGCWNKAFIANGQFVQNNTVVLANGTYRGCKVDNITTDSHSGKKIPSYVPICTVFSGASPYGQLFCSNNGQWKVDVANSNRVKNKTVAWSLNDSVVASDCCSTTSCWTGSACQADQLSTASPLSYFGYRCEAGTWVSRPLKYNWDRSSSGYCPSDNQCLVDPNGAAASNNNTAKYFDTAAIRPQCIAPGQSILDHYCENGIWTTRTRFLALALLDYADAVSATNYRLFCGTSTEALNAPESVASLVGSASCAITGTSVPCVNNFCVLSTPSGNAWGVTLNKPVDDSKSILPAIGKSADFCSGADGPGFEECSAPSGIWYDPALNGVISIPSGVIGTISWPDLFLTFIKSPLDGIKLFVFTSLHKPLNDYTFFNNTHTFNKLYAARASDKHIFAFLEEGIFENSIRRDYIGAEYDDVDLGANPCLDLILRYDNLASCNVTSTSLQIVRQKTGSPTTPGPLIQAWRDLTAKLRLG